MVKRGPPTGTRNFNEEDLEFREAKRFVHDASESGKSAKMRYPVRHLSGFSAESK